MLISAVPRYKLVLLLLIVAVAAAFRFIALDYAPSGGHGDVAWVGINALDWVDNGIWPFYVRELYAPEFFPVYLTGLLLPLTGISYLPQRIMTAFFGVLFVLFLFPATWWLLDDRPANFRANAGLLAALAGAVSLHVVALQRLGMESPPFLTIVALLIWWTARAWRRGGSMNWALAGVALALAQYVFLAARLLPLVLVLWIAHSWWADRARLRQQWRGWLVMAAVSFVLTLPALILFVTTPEAFSARADAGTAQTGGWIWQYDTSTYGGALSLIVQKIGLTLQALGLAWDGPYNIMNLPMLAPLFFLGLVMALLLSIRHFRHIAYGWLLLAIPVMLITDLISGAVLEIHALHQMGVLPFIYILAGIGLAHGWEFARNRLMIRVMRYGLVAVLVMAALLPSVFSIAHYLNVVIPGQYADPLSGWQRVQTDVDLGRYIVSNADRAFLLPYSEYSRSDVAWVIADGFRTRRSAMNEQGILAIANPPETVSVIFPTNPERPRHDGFPAQFDPRLWVLLRDDQVLLLPPLTAEQVEMVLEAQTSIEPAVLTDQSQTDIAQIYTLPASGSLFAPRPAIDFEIDAVFNDEIQLLGYTLPQQDLQPGQVTYVSLFWQPLRPPVEDYEIFVQLWGDDQNAIGSTHDFPWGGMYRSRIWQPDEIVVTHHWIEVPHGLAVGRYTLVAGLFRLLHNENLPVTGPDADPERRIAIAPDLRFAPSAPEFTGTPPEQPLRFGDVLTLKGLETGFESGQEWVVTPGDRVTFDLFWAASGRPRQDYSVFLHLSDALDAPPVAQADASMGGLFPSGAWRAGDVIRDRLRLQIPPDLAPGTYEVLLGTYFWQTGERLPAYVDDVTSEDGRVKLGQVVVRASDE